MVKVNYEEEVIKKVDERYGRYADWSVRKSKKVASLTGALMFFAIFLDLIYIASCVYYGSDLYALIAMGVFTACEIVVFGCFAAKKFYMRKVISRLLSSLMFLLPCLVFVYEGYFNYFWECYIIAGIQLIMFVLIVVAVFASFKDKPSSKVKTKQRVNKNGETYEYYPAGLSAGRLVTAIIGIVLAVFCTVVVGAISFNPDYDALTSGVPLNTSRRVSISYDDETESCSIEKVYNGFAEISLPANCLMLTTSGVGVYPVTTVTSSAFSELGSSVTEITLPETITTVADDAFEGSDITTVTVSSDSIDFGSSLANSNVQTLQITSAACDISFDDSFDTSAITIEVDKEYIDYYREVYSDIASSFAPVVDENEVYVNFNYSDYSTVILTKGSDGSVTVEEDPFTDGETRKTENGVEYQYIWWTEDADGNEEAITFPYTITESINIYAKWVQVYTLGYVLYGGEAEGTLAADTYYTNGTITLPEATKTVGTTTYTFMGWYTSADFSASSAITEIADTITSNLTLYAKFLQNYTVTYDYGTTVYDSEATNSGEYPAYYHQEMSTISLGGMSCTGYTFGGWYLDSGFTTSIASIAYGSTGDITLYAKWTPIVYDICYVAADLVSGLNDANAATYTVEDTISLADLSLDGYTFGGWYYDADFTSLVDNAAAIVEGTIDAVTLYAQWTLNTPDFNASGTNGVEATYDGTAYSLTVDMSHAAPSERGISYTYVWTDESGAEVSKYTGVAGENTHSYAVTNVLQSGTYTCTVYATDGTYTSATVFTVLTAAISQREITITAADKTVVYGTTSVEYGYKVTSGSIVEGDDLKINVTSDYTAATPVGEYADYITVTAENSNYDITTISNKFTVTVRAITVTIGKQESTYGNDITVDNNEYEVTEGTVVNNDDLGITLQTTTDNTSYVATYSGAITCASFTNENYDITFISGDWVVNKRIVTLDWSTLSEEELVYTHEAKTLTATAGNLANGDEVSVTVELTADCDNINVTEAGFTYTAISLSNSDNYVLPSNVTSSIYNITNAEMKVEANGNSVTYDGNYYTGSVTAETVYDDYVITYGTEDGVYTTTTIPEYKDADTYIVYYQVKADNHKTETGSFTVEISPKEITVTIGTQSSTYGDNITVDNNEYEVTEGTKVNDDDLGITLKTTTDNTSNVGTYAGAITCESYTNKNYEITFVSGAWTIDQRTVTLSWPELSNLVYTGEAKTLTATAGNLANGDEVTVTVVLTGNNTIVTDEVFYYTATALNDSNYKLPDDVRSAEYTITNADLKVEVEDYSGTYDGKEHWSPITVTTVDGADVTETYGESEDTCTEAIITHTNAGTYTVYYKLSAANHNDYISYYTVTINNAELTVSSTDYSCTYDGAKHTGSVSATTVDGTEATITYGEEEGSYTSDTIISYTNADTYTVYYQVTAANHDTETGSFIVTINNAELTVNATNHSGTYDGVAHTGSVSATTVGNCDYTVTYGTAKGSYTSDTIITYTNSGTYTVYYKVTAANHNDYTDSFTVTINNAELTVNATNHSGTYDGVAHTGSVSVTTVGNCDYTVTYGTAKGSYTSDTIITYTDAGTYTVYYKVTADNHNDYTDSFTVTITNATIDVTPTNYNVAYDGESHTGSVEATTVDGTSATIMYGTTSGTYNLTSAPTYTNVCEETVYYQIKAANHTTATGSFTVTITQATNTLSGTLTITGWTYGETANSPSGITAKFGTVQYQYSDATNGTYTTTVPTSAGTHYVKAYVTGTANYTEITSDPVEFTIAEADITANVTNYSGIYDGVAHTGSVEATTVDGTTATIMYGTTLGTYNSTSAPEYTNVCEETTVYYQITADNHETVTGSFTVTITNATIGVKAENYNAAYDGIAHTGSVEATTVDGTTATIMYGTTSGTYSLTSAPEYTNVCEETTVYYQITAANHTTVTGSFTVTITQATNTLSGTPTIAGWTYGEAANSPSVVTATFGTVQYQYSDAENGTYTTTVPTNAGTYYVKAYVEGTDNYTEVSAVVPFTIAKSDDNLSGTLSISDFIYNEGTCSPSGISSAEGTVEYVYCSTKDGAYNTTAPTAAGTYYVKAHVAETDNYNEAYSSAESFTIAKSDSNLSGTLSISNFIYNEGTCSPSGISSAEGTVEYVYCSTKDGAYNTTAPTAAGSYYVKAHVAETDNYNEAYSSAESFTITKKQVTAPTKDTTTYTYTGEAQTYTLATSDYYTISGTTQTNAGTYTVTVTLNDTANYVWYDGTTEAKTYTFEISKATEEISVSIDDWAYGETANSPSISISNDEQKDLTVTYTYYKDNNGAIGDEVADISNADAGTYWVVATVAATTNYTETSASKSFTIEASQSTPETGNTEGDNGGTEDNGTEDNGNTED